MVSEQSNPEPAGASTDPPAGFLRRACRTLTALPGKLLRKPLLLIAALVVLFGIGAGVYLVAGSGADEGQYAIERALEKLDAGDYDEALRIVDDLRTENLLRYDHLSRAVYIYGIVTAAEAEQRWSEVERSQLFLIAARYLDEGRDLGFPAGREAEGIYRLAVALHHSHRYAESLSVLHEAIALNPDRHPQLYKLLATSYLSDTPANLEQALVYNERYMATDTLDESEKLAGWLQRADIYFRLGDAAAARDVLQHIPADSDRYTDAIIAEARLLMREGDVLAGTATESAPADRSLADEKYRQAMALLNTAEGRDRLNSNTSRGSQYLIGLCLRKLGDARAAETQFARIRRLHFSTAEGLAAGVEEAELQRLRGADDVALTTYRRVLTEAGDPESFTNIWISLEELRARLVQAYSDLIQREKYREAIDLTKLLPPVIPVDQAVMLRAETYLAWATALQQQAANLPVPEAEVQRATARARFREAGETFEKLAKLRVITRHYPDDLWHSADSYLRGRDYAQAISMLQQYLHHETRLRRPRALIALGESYLAMNELDKALIPLEECVEFYPRDPDSYRARVIAAQTYLEKGDSEEAKKLLQANLHHESLTPDSIEWRDSQFLLGKIHYREGVQFETDSRRKGVDHADSEVRKLGLAELKNAYASFHEANAVLSEAVQRYATAPQAIEARYMIAQCYRQGAKYPLKRLPLITIETNRNALVRQLQQELTTALEKYSQLQDLLNQQQQRQELPPLEQAILRNCYFGRADVLFDLNRYEDAIEAYTNATNRFQDEPTCLEAYVQIANCLRRLNRPVEARGTLEQAKVVLAGLRPDADFLQTTRFNRTQWTAYLDWLASNYEPAQANTL